MDIQNKYKKQFFIAKLIIYCFLLYLEEEHKKQYLCCLQ